MEILFGQCNCGCHGKTRIPTKSNRANGDIRGVPKTFLRGHSTHKRAGGTPFTQEEAIAAFWAKVDKRGPNKCWPWTGCINSSGYGNVQFEGKIQGAHIVSWIL